MQHNYENEHFSGPVYSIPFSYEDGKEMFRFVLPSTLYHFPIRLQMKTVAQENTSMLKPRPNALDFSLYIARQMSSIVECCREGVAKRSRLFTRLGTQHSTDVLFDE